MRSLFVSLSLLAAGTLGNLGCGKVSVTFDAPTGGTDAPTGGIDANLTPDAQTQGPVTITVLNTDQSGTTVQGVHVVFFNPDGSMVADAISDANGQVTATIKTGASATTVWPKSATQYLIATLYSIKPNDNLVVGFRNADTTDAGTFLVTYPAYSGATSYTIYGPCGTADANNTLHFTVGCKQDPFDVYVLAFNANNQLLATNSKNAVSFSSGSVSLPANGWKIAGVFTASYNDVPSNITSIEATHYSAYPTAYMTNGTGTPASSMLNITPFTSANVGSYAYVLNSFSQSNANAFQRIQQRIAGAATSNTVDVGATLLAWISTGTFAPANQTFTATTTGGSGSYAMYISDVQYTRPGQTPINYEWIALGPTVGPMTLPTLPADAGGVNPLATDTINDITNVIIDDDSQTWDDVRAHSFDEFRTVLGNASMSQLARVSYTVTSTD